VASGNRIPLREGSLGGDGDLGLLAGDGDGVTKVPGLAAGDLDALLQELLQRRDVHDLVLHGLGAVDHESDRTLLLGAAFRRRAARHLFLLLRLLVLGWFVSGGAQATRVYRTGRGPVNRDLYISHMGSSSRDK
jgi:hypothetical protein